jgi:DNA-binding CsgD family transcriptional regulator
MQAVLDAERATEVDQVVASLYDGVVCPGDWYDALDASRLALGADSFHLFTLRRRDATVLGPVLSNVVEASAPGGEPLGLLGAMTRGAPVGVPLPSHGPTAVLAIVLRTDEETREVLGFVRDSAGAPWGAASRAVFDCLAPHLVRASGLRAHILHLTGPAAIGLSTLDGLAQGMAVVDEECRVQYLNRAAQACCSEEGGVGRVAHGRLLPAQVPQQPAFRQLVRLACEPSGSATGGVLRARAGAGAVVGISVWPLKASHRHLALVVFAGQAAVTSAGPCALGRVLGLTPSEAGLALLLAEGKTLKDFADLRRCTGHTARSHLKNLMQKTGCHRQMELVQLVQAMRPAWSAGPAPARPEPVAPATLRPPFP